MRAEGSPPAINRLVLSLFPGVDLFGMAFEAEGFCVVRGPDLITGGDVRSFHAPPGCFGGVIGGSPCQDFSSLRRGPESGNGRALLAEFLRVVAEARPAWFLLENVPGVPDVALDGYTVQRIDVRGTEVGLRQRRLRHFQFGAVTPRALTVPRRDTAAAFEPACVASEGRRQGRRGWEEFCALMGLPKPIDLPGWSVSARYRAVGNGVPLPMGRLLARAIVRFMADDDAPAVAVCLCGCGRPVDGKAVSAGPACRKRLERRRRVTELRPAVRGPSRPACPPGECSAERGPCRAVCLSECDAAGVTQPGTVTAGPSRDPARPAHRRPVTLDERIARQYDPAATPLFETVTSRGCFSIAASHEGGRA